MGQYQLKPASSLVRPVYGASPSRAMFQTGQGTLSHPKPPKQITLHKSKLPAPSLTTAPGAQGTI